MARLSAAASTIRTKAADFLLSRQPRLVSTLLATTGVIILLGLGTWQMVRLNDKNALLRLIGAQLAEAPLMQTAIWPKTADAWGKLQYRPIVLQGTWQALHSFKLSPRTYDGQVGYHLIVPLRLADDQIVLVNRGFVPDGASQVPPSETMAMIDGVARIAETKRPWATPENIPSRNEWNWVDIIAMGHEVGFGTPAPIVLYESRDPERNGYPIGGQLPQPQHNRHAEYALTWYLLALGLTLIWLIASGPSKTTAAPDKSAGNDEPDDPVAKRDRYPEATD